MREVIDPLLSYKKAAHVTWQFANEMKIGDIIFVKKGMSQLVGRGVVTSDYEYDDERTDEYSVNGTMNRIIKSTVELLLRFDISKS
ncbi:hypothetical protein I4Q36_05245 [Tuanshanicoccus lijuaniae]|nr:hypothetical protein I4Q36_05245 [Aerococcaceae bacterium zg-1292]